MKKILILCASLMTVMGCDVIETPIAENNYQSALSSGNLPEQLRYIDELSHLAPEKYADIASQKEKLLPYLLQVMDDPKNLVGIPDRILKEIIEFSPKNEAFSFIKKYLNDKQRINELITKNVTDLEQEKQFLVDKMSTTPSHVTTYETNVKLALIKPYFLLSEYVKAFNRRFGSKPLNGFQIEAIARSLSKQYELNEATIDAIDSLNLLNISDDKVSNVSFNNENQDIAQVLLWLYKKQLIVSYQHTTKQNAHLLSLLNNQYGVQSLDDVWLKKVEPIAKKIVMETKEGHLNVLNIMSSKLAKMSAVVPRLNNIYVENDKIEKLMLALLWPSEGLINFEPKSPLHNKTLWLEVNKKQQL